MQFVATNLDVLFNITGSSNTSLVQNITFSGLTFATTRKTVLAPHGLSLSWICSMSSVSCRCRCAVWWFGASYGNVVLYGKVFQVTGGSSAWLQSHCRTHRASHSTPICSPSWTCAYYQVLRHYVTWLIGKRHRSERPQSRHADSRQRGVGVVIVL